MGWIAWTKEEDDIIHQFYQGTSWDDLSRILPGRTCDAIKGRALHLGVRRIPPRGEKVKLSKRRAISVSEDCGVIALSNGGQAIVDKDDYDWLIFFAWHKSESNGDNYYARTSVKTAEGEIVSISMHRLILNPPDHIVIDHINHDGLDNRKSNLRLCYAAQNLMNQKQGRGASKFKGVHPRISKDSIRWQAYINFEGKQTHLGFFDTEEDAAKAYDRHAKNLFGEFAKLNFPES